MATEPIRSQRPLTAIDGIRYDRATKDFSLRVRPHNAAAQLVHRHQLGRHGPFTQPHIAAWQLDAIGVSVVSVVDAMEHPGTWRTIAPSNPAFKLQPPPEPGGHDGD